MSNLLSYTNILNDRKNFMSAGTTFGHDFNILDVPSQKYFKILFYFGSASEDFTPYESSGLLAPTWEIFEAISGNYDQNRELSDEEKKEYSDIEFSFYEDVHYYDFNSAWAFLKLNDENERAEKLERFVTLLSDISSKSPWYFSSVSGVQEALERKVTEDGKLDMSERKKISINCLPDAFDNRIGTLLELYRDITWSWAHKKEIVPANLRKFDMAIYIFETPDHNWHNNYEVIDTKNPSKFKVGYKMIEFHDCEFNYNSVKSAWTTIDNQIGLQPTYQIDINYNDCYEVSYNDIMMRTIGDVILTDLVNNSLNENDYKSQSQIDGSRELLNAKIGQNDISDFSFLVKKQDNNSGLNLMPNTTTTRFGNLADRTGNTTNNIDVDYKIEYEPGFVGNAIGQAVGHATAWVKSKINRAVMGNLFTFSLTQLRDQAKDLLGGNLIKTGMSIAEYAREANARKDARKKQKPNGDIFPEPEPRDSLTPRNLYSGSTIANNI
jgi:hypothetical protein